MTSIDQLYSVIREPLLTEKGTDDRGRRNAYHFRVPADANKVEIRQAVEDLFDVTVTDVRTVAVKSKPKKRGASRGRRPGWKKAIVELKPGDKIELFEGA